MTDKNAENVARGIREQGKSGSWFEMNGDELEKLIATALREYGEALRKEWDKEQRAIDGDLYLKADAEGYQRGFHEGQEGLFERGRMSERLECQRRLDDEYRRGVEECATELERCGHFKLADRLRGTGGGKSKVFPKQYKGHCDDCKGFQPMSKVDSCDHSCHHP